MTPDTESVKKFAVIQFLERPYRDISRYVCVPSSWITHRLPNSRAAIVYPREDVNVTRNRVENNEPPATLWPAFMALIVHESDDYNDADIWIKKEEKQIASEIINLDNDVEDDDMCEALIYISESDDNEDCSDETDILILKQDKPSESDEVGVPDNVNEPEIQEDADILVSKQNKPSEPEDTDMPDKVDNIENQEHLDIVIKSENIDGQDNNVHIEQHDIDTLIIKEDPYKEESSESKNVGTNHNLEGVEHSNADIITAENDIILPKTENIDIEENFNSVGDNDVNTLTSMEEQTPKSICETDVDDDDLGLNDLIILGEKKSESDHTIAVDSNEKTGNAIEDTVMERHIEYRKTSLNIETIEKSLVETNTVPTPSTSKTLQPSEIPRRPSISVVSEHFLRYGCQEQKQIPENSTHERMQALQSLTKTIYATETMKTQLITKAQIHENPTSFNETGSYPQGEAHALSILKPNEVNRAYDQNVSNNVSYPLEYTGAQHSSQQITQPFAKSKPKKAPAKEMKLKAPIEKVRRYNPMNYHQHRGYTYIAPHDPQIGNIQPQNIPMNSISFEQNQLYRANVQHLPVPGEQLTVDNSTENMIVRTTTGRNPLILNASQNNRHTIPKSAQHFLRAGNQLSHDFAPNCTVSGNSIYPAQPVYANQIPNQQSTQQNELSVIVHHYNQPYSNSANINANQFASGLEDYSVVQDLQSKLLFHRKPTEIQTYNQLPLIQNSYQAILPATQTTSANVPSNFPDQLPIYQETQRPTGQTQQIFERGPIIMDQHKSDAQSTSQNNSKANQGCPHCPCSQLASTTTTSPVDTRISSSTDEQFNGKNVNSDNNNTDVSAVQNQLNKVEDEQNSVSQINTGSTKNGSVVTSESVPESRLAADHQESPKRISPACSTGEKIVKPGNECHSSSNVTNELESVTAAIKAFERMVSQAEITICKQTEAYKARHNKMFERDKEFKKMIETIIRHCDSRINKVRKLKSKNRLNNPNNRKRKVI
ncbi:uncharacterized protein LOC118278102 isoform X2 [Spodoptera frugiperda]|uniref:Uncharacterized protein LOC118278102 isoform X2 n=1 Tax=Spodoptera frugiperda TaxID=7108 RepID=A0A9R0DYF4_SPOFR|nr:uncharacterized protein LOC118278102 isoform X2 [Spodoptera frugiperda]